MSIKYKHFLFFGIGGPIVNTLVWFILRLDDQGILGSDGEEILSNGTKSPLCLFVEERNLDIYVMQVFILHHNMLTYSLILHQGMKKHINMLQVPMLVILVFNTFFLIWVILVGDLG